MGWDLQDGVVLGTLKTFCEAFTEVKELQQWSAILRLRQASFADLHSDIYLRCLSHSPRRYSLSSIYLQPHMDSTLHQ